MIKRHCDRCGREIAPSERRYRMYVVENGTGINICSRDICCGCLAEVTAKKEEVKSEK